MWYRGRLSAQLPLPPDGSVERLPGPGGDGVVFRGYGRPPRNSKKRHAYASGGARLLLEIQPGGAASNASPFVLAAFADDDDTNNTLQQPVWTIVVGAAGTPPPASSSLAVSRVVCFCCDMETLSDRDPCNRGISRGCVCVTVVV